jgi:hypothetical protein
VQSVVSSVVLTSSTRSLPTSDTFATTSSRSLPDEISSASPPNPGQEAPIQAGLSTAAKAGICVGAVIGALIIGLGVFYLGRSARKKTKNTLPEPDATSCVYDGKAEIDGKQVNNETIPELDGSQTVRAPYEHAKLHGSTQASTTSPLPPIYSVNRERSPETSDPQAQSTHSAMQTEAVQSMPTNDEARKAPASDRRSRTSSVDVAESTRLSSDAIQLDQPAPYGLDDPRLTQNPWA